MQVKLFSRYKIFQKLICSDLENEVDVLRIQKWLYYVPQISVWQFEHCILNKYMGNCRLFKVRALTLKK